MSEPQKPKDPETFDRVTIGGVDAPSEPIRFDAKAKCAGPWKELALTFIFKRWSFRDQIRIPG